MKVQRRGTAIAMTSDERDEFLATERACRVATVGADGAPHATALWFVWDGAALGLPQDRRPVGAPAPGQCGRMSGPRRVAASRRITSPLR